jgi:hypothetical protein
LPGAAPFRPDQCEHTFALSHPDYIRAKAVELRTERNLSIDEIAERLALSRTTVYYHADQDLHELRQLWGDQLGISPEQIRMQRKSNGNQLAGRTWRSVHGVLAVTVHDTLLRAKLDGWMDRLRESWL